MQKLYERKPEVKKPEIKKDSPVEITSPEIYGLNIVIGSLKKAGFTNESTEVKRLLSKIEEIRKAGAR